MSLLYLHPERKLSLSYDQVYANLQSENQIVLNPIFKDKTDFFKHVLTAICHHLPITLLDADQTPQELEEILNAPYQPQIETTVALPIQSLNELQHAFLNSKSTITLFTSGTTGKPKQITHSIQSLIQGVKYGPKYAQNIWAYTYPPTHMAGLQVFLQAVMNGNILIDCYGIGREMFFSYLNTYHITHISATPTFYRLLFPVDESFNEVLKVTLGGEKSDKQLHQQLEHLFPNAQIYNIYASTETGTLLVSHGDGFKIPDQNQHVVKIIDDQLAVHKDKIGVSNQLQFVDDWYLTGDIIEWINQSNGLFKIVSRNNEMINTGGYKVNPHEIENFIRTLNGVQDVVVYGKSNAVLGQIVCCEISITEKFTLDESQLKKLLQSQFQSYKVPRIIKFSNQLMVGTTGKTIRTL